ncbi:MAG: hypothetical protein HQ556_09915 [Candidatus Marinimicrobia bacterium]|nr:hypothetical protein [Candidatus Neomarinimicrobiota bacterium]
MTQKTPKWILFFQYVSLGFIWLLVLGIIVWIINLMKLSNYLHDAQNATIVISLIIIPIFITLAGVLSYVFFGLKRANREEITK